MRRLRDQRHRSLLRTAQEIVENQNWEKGISRDGELHCGESSGRGTDSIQPVEIEIYRDASAFDDHPLKSAGRHSEVFCLDWAA